MREELARDERVFVLGEDVGRRGGVFLATDGFVDEFGEDRIIDTPLAESSIAGIALGAAMNGMRPIAEIQFADFIWPTFNQLLGEAAKARYGSEGRVGAPLVARDAVRRRRARRPVPLPERRGLLRPQPWYQGGRPRDSI